MECPFNPPFHQGIRLKARSPQDWTGWSLMLVICAIGSLGCQRTRDSHPATSASLTTVGLNGNSEKRVIAFCSACHVMPLPESFPKDAWHHEVMRGYEFYAKSGRKDLDPPPPRDAIAYFRELAPEQLDLSKALKGGSAQPPLFQLESVKRTSSNDPVPPGLAYMSGGGLLNDLKNDLFAVDMRRGEVLQLTRGKESTWVPRFRGLRNPCHFISTDLDGNQKRDAVIADLGSYNPEDHAFGRVLWLHERENGGTAVDELMIGVGRVADARTADFDGDGVPELVVAEFGWQKTGGVWLLSQEPATQKGKLQFARKKLLDLHGASHVPVGDFDGDGKLDLVSLVSQEYERLILFHNQGESNFKQRVIWQAPDPAFGLSGVEPVDLDNDGDLDLLFTSGDTFDSPYLKPSHGIHWLENKGSEGFAYHRIANLLAAYSARAGDLDGDGDLDIAASCWAPRELPSGVDPATMPAIVCGIQKSPGNFEMSVLHRGAPIYVALALVDIDEDGDLDVAAGSHLVNLENATDGGLLFLNQHVKQKAVTQK